MHQISAAASPKWFERRSFSPMYIWASIIRRRKKNHGTNGKNDFDIRDKCLKRRIVHNNVEFMKRKKVLLWQVFSVVLLSSRFRYILFRALLSSLQFPFIPFHWLRCVFILVSSPKSRTTYCFYFRLLFVLVAFVVGTSEYIENVPKKDGIHTHIYHYHSVYFVWARPLRIQRFRILFRPGTWFGGCAFVRCTSFQSDGSQNMASANHITTVVATVREEWRSARGKIRR